MTSKPGFFCKRGQNKGLFINNFTKQKGGRVAAFSVFFQSFAQTES
jgi:hypothetical protein